MADFFNSLIDLFSSESELKTPPKTPTAAPQPQQPPPPPPWYQGKHPLVRFVEGGTQGDKFVDENGMIKMYWDKVSNNKENISFVKDKGVGTIGSGFTFNLDTGGAITEGMKISKETHQRWLNTFMQSFDEAGQKAFPEFWAKAKPNEKEALAGYFHQFTGYPMKDPQTGKMVFVWNFNVAPTTAGMLKQGYTPEIIQKVAKEISEKGGQNKARNASVAAFMKHNQVLDFSIPGRRDIIRVVGKPVPDPDEPKPKKTK